LGKLGNLEEVKNFRLNRLENLIKAFFPRNIGKGLKKGVFNYFPIITRKGVGYHYIYFYFCKRRIIKLVFM